MDQASRRKLVRTCAMLSEGEREADILMRKAARAAEHLNQQETWNAELQDQVNKMAEELSKTGLLQDVKQPQHDSLQNTDKGLANAAKTMQLDEQPFMSTSSEPPFVFTGTRESRGMAEIDLYLLKYTNITQETLDEWKRYVVECGFPDVESGRYLLWDQLPLRSKRPFMISVNKVYHGQHQHVSEFFKGLRVREVTVPYSEDRYFRGIAWIDFETLDDMKEGLWLVGTRLFELQTRLFQANQDAAPERAPPTHGSKPSYDWGRPDENNESDGGGKKLIKANVLRQLKEEVARLKATAPASSLHAEGEYIGTPPGCQN